MFCCNHYTRFDQFLTVFLCKKTIYLNKNCVFSTRAPCYNAFATAPRQVQKGGYAIVNSILSFMLSILASVIAYYICKWLDGK